MSATPRGYADVLGRLVERSKCSACSPDGNPALALAEAVACGHGRVPEPGVVAALAAMPSALVFVLETVSAAFGGLDGSCAEWPAICVAAVRFVCALGLASPAQACALDLESSMLLRAAPETAGSLWAPDG